MTELHSKAMSDKDIQLLKEHYRQRISGLAIYHEDTRGFWVRVLDSLKQKEEEPRTQVCYGFFHSFVRIRRTGQDSFQVAYKQFKNAEYERVDEGLTLDQIVDLVVTELNIKKAERRYNESHIAYKCSNCGNISMVYKYSEDGKEESEE